MCVMAWSPAAWSASRSPVVSLEVAGECAGPRGAGALREEVALRLPPGSTLSRGAEDASWVLEWSPDEVGACGLRLRGNGEFVVVPLEAMAGSTELREAAVRVAWWITTVEPAAEPEAPTPGVSAKVGGEPPADRPLEVEPATSPIEGEVDRGSREGAAGAPSGAKPDAMDVLISKLDEPEPEDVPAPRIKDSVLQITESLNGWKTESPGLFGELDESMTQPWVVDVFGEEVPARLYIEGAPRWTAVASQPASGLGIHVGATLAERFGLGVAYTNMEAQGNGVFGDLDTHELSVVASYSPWMNESWALGVQAEAGLALAVYEGAGVEIVPVLGARSHMLYRLATWIEVGGALGFQFYGGTGELPGGLGADDLSRPYVQALVRVSLF